MKINKKDYSQLSDKYSNNSKIFKNCLNAFLIGGLICLMGQIFLNVYINLGMDKTNSANLVSMTLVFISSFLTGVGWYDDIAKVAGAGTLVPITGFANAITAPALEFKSEGYVMGLSAKLFIIAGPVITYGISASVIYGIIFFILNM